jgi:F-type H+-transporting ATPase subunit b
MLVRKITMMTFFQKYYRQISAAALILLVAAVPPGIASASPQTALVSGVVANAEADSAPSSEKAAETKEANPLEFKSDLALWTAVVFLLLMLLLWKFAWGPLADGLDKREKHVADQIAQANDANQKAKDLLVEY